jgi:hypothetical protein
MYVQDHANTSRRNNKGGSGHGQDPLKEKCTKPFCANIRKILMLLW